MSERNRRGMADIAACVADREDVVHLVFIPGMDLRVELAGLAARGVGLIVVNSGDGLVHGLLGALLGGGAFAVPPPVAILPRGMTNMTAADVGLGAGSPQRLLQLLEIVRAGELERHLVRRRVLAVAYDPAKPVERGMFMGAAGIYDTIQLTTGHIHKQGFKGAWASVAAIATVLGRALFRGPERIGLGGETIGIGLDGGPVERRPRAMVLATTLDRLVLGSRPFWDTGTAPIHFTAFDHPARGLLRHARTILFGGRERRLPDPPFHSQGASRIELHLERPFTIDGEFFQPPAGVPVVVTAEDEVRFVKLRG